MSSAYVQPAWRGPTPNSGRPLDHATYTRPLGPGPRSLDAVPPTSPPSNPRRARHGAAGEGQPLGMGCRGSLRSLGEPRLRAAGILSLSRARVAAPAGRRVQAPLEWVATHVATTPRPIRKRDDLVQRSSRTRSTSGCGNSDEDDIGVLVDQLGITSPDRPAAPAEPDVCRTADPRGGATGRTRYSVSTESCARW